MDPKAIHGLLKTGQHKAVQNGYVIALPAGGSGRGRPRETIIAIADICRVGGKETPARHRLLRVIWIAVGGTRASFCILVRSSDECSNLSHMSSVVRR